MVKIKNSNIIIDEFNIQTKYDDMIYFLTHMHSDHFKGLT